MLPWELCLLSFLLTWRSLEKCCQSMLTINYGGCLVITCCKRVHNEVFIMKVQILLSILRVLECVWNETTALCHRLEVSLVSLSLFSCNGYEICFFLEQCKCHQLVFIICSRLPLKPRHCPEECKVWFLLLLRFMSNCQMSPGECLKSLQKYI